MNLPEFRAEVLRHLPALASWEFSTQWGDHVILNARHSSGTARVFYTDDIHGPYWHIESLHLPASMCRTLAIAAAHFRQRHADMVATLADLSATEHHAPKTAPAEGKMEAA